MAVPVFCNSCYCKPHQPTPRFCLTTCGHVFCEACLHKGKKDECLICKTACQTLVLSKQTNPDVQALFTGVDVLCKKYAKEITQILEFQEKHRKHLLLHYKQKILKLIKTTLNLYLLSCFPFSMKPPEKPALPFSSISRNSLSIPSRKQNGYSSYPLHSSRPSTSEMVESMEIDPVPSPMRKV
ncbi:RN212 ligase, partial [Furnarius figulus]|nr:RN212 ligase [Furnarius figulus]